MLAVQNSIVKVYYVSQLFVSNTLLSNVQWLPKFPISLAIQLVRPNEYCTCLFSCVYQYHISRKSLVRTNFNQVADPDSFGSTVHNHTSIHINPLV